ncbi:eukaryotic and archaeal DNA primase small subunit [Niveomyces insectorum RCEF 264]|uniref:DNA primase n=1 Tax=Niveomyces insectorum RCEF 264 TaxID=1081102 RepID=A0A167X947_9HYPO|nr:eukaryotic and archaeal DNA primase small subunit [Niveomyces insectorum RCEF 264]
MPHSVGSQPSSPSEHADAAMEEDPALDVDGGATGNNDGNDNDIDVGVVKADHSSPPVAGEGDAMDVDIADTGKVELPAVPAQKETSEVNLDDLFADDDDEDDEFPSSMPQKGNEPTDAPTSPVAGDALSHAASDPEVMRSFYQRLFPWRYLFQWLNHSPTSTSDFAHREFAFTLQNDAYLRYQSFPTADLLRKDVLRLLPSRFEIGPVYTTNPRDRKALSNTSAFKPLAKELCFDIDLTDYDDIRTCCDKATICHRCWQFITMAIGVVDSALRDDFGFRHILWVYSGRRGAHAWVCDRAARALSDQKRRAVAGYLEVLRGGAQGGKRVNVRRPLHPHLTRSLALLRTHFQEDVLRAQDPWDTPERAEKLLALLPHKGLADALRRKWDTAPGRPSTAKWADIDAVAKAGAVTGLDGKALLEAKQDIVLEYTYPRLDIEVSKKLNHLLKSPFVVHPGTGRVCVPIDTRKLDEFDPLGVPTVQSLLQEIDAWQQQHQQQDQQQHQQQPGDDTSQPDAPAGGDAKPLQDWEKTSLKPYIEQFRSFVLALLRDETDVKVKREREEGNGMEF